MASFEPLETISSTPSTTSEDASNISFDNITYTVRKRSGLRCIGERKVVLNDLSGEFVAGELAAIVGPSGAGKSSLMDILAGNTKPTSGNILLNNSVRNEKEFRRRSCYILQDDQVQAQLTVSESMAIAAELKLGNHISAVQKCKRIEEILKALRLSEDKVRSTRAGRLSGGQKKRLAIGLELLSDPTVMFLDEPTSGLDCSMSTQMVRLLRELAQQGRTVVVTIHQPSAKLLDMVDRLYAVVHGKCAYMGSMGSLRPYLVANGEECPRYHDLVDLLIEKCESTSWKQLVTSSVNGKNMEWLAETTDRSISSGSSNTSEGSNKSVECGYLTSLPRPKENPTNKILRTLKGTYSTSRWNQFTTLTRRSLLSSWRDPQFLLTSTGIHIMMAFSVGILFYNIGEKSGKYMEYNINYLYFSLMFLMFTAFSTVTISFPRELPMVRREHFNRWYSTGAYYGSTLISILPAQTVCTLSYATISYLLTGQPLHYERFSLFAATLLMVSYVALFIGLLNGSIFNVQNGVVFGPLFIMPFTIFSGFFLRYPDASPFFRWLFDLSFLKHGLIGLMIAIFGKNRKILECLELICFNKNPGYFLKKFMTGDSHVDKEPYAEPEFWVVCVALLAISVVVVTLSYVILRIRLKQKW